MGGHSTPKISALVSRNRRDENLSDSSSNTDIKNDSVVPGTLIKSHCQCAGTCFSVPLHWFHTVLISVFRSLASLGVGLFPSSNMQQSLRGAGPPMWFCWRWIVLSSQTWAVKWLDGNCFPWRAVSWKLTPSKQTEPEILRELWLYFCSLFSLFIWICVFWRFIWVGGVSEGTDDWQNVTNIRCF